MVDKGSGPPPGAALVEARSRFPVLAEVLEVLAAPATADELRDTDRALAAFRNRSPIPGPVATGGRAVARLPRPRAAGRPALAAVAVLALATGGVTTISMITSSGLTSSIPSHPQVSPSIQSSPPARTGETGRTDSAAPGSSGSATAPATAATTAPATTSQRCPLPGGGGGAMPTDMPSYPPPSSGWPSQPPPWVGVESRGGCPPAPGSQRPGGLPTGGPPSPFSPPPQGGRQGSTQSLPPLPGRPPAVGDRPPGGIRDGRRAGGPYPSAPAAPTESPDR